MSIKIKKYIEILAFVFIMISLTSCSLQKVVYTPYPEHYITVDSVNFINGYAKQKQPWVVFSDRYGNKINPTKKEDPFTQFKETSFLKPFIVLKEKKGMFKVAEYKSELINEAKFFRLKKLKTVGWIPKDHLLLWTNGLRNTKTGFVTKTAVVVNHSNVISFPEKYIENDSAIVFSDPDLINKITKVAIGSLVYIYKYSENKDRVLIGKKQATVTDSISNNIYGWVSKKMIDKWGERTSIKLLNDTVNVGIKITDSVKHFAVLPNEIHNRTKLQSIYPEINDKEIKFFSNAFNYDKNSIYNVLGNTIYYQKYKEILNNNKKLNVVFVLDVSKNNRLYMPIVKSLLQELQLNFINRTYFSSIKFGGVVYKQNNCDINILNSSLSTNYRDIALFFETKINELTCNDSDIVQPVHKGILSATQMLQNAENETNIIILIGTTANESTQSQTTINAVSRVNAKMICFQTQSKSADAYNDFVLLCEKTVVNSAKNSTELKKEKIVNQNDLLINNSYNLTTGENGVYYLDYPTQSMTQGFVIFPKKGETMQAGVLKSAIDTLIVQVTKDNEKVDNTLTKYFRSEIGVNNTKIASPYCDLFNFNNKEIPTQIAASLLNKNNSFLFKGQLVTVANTLQQPYKQQGVLLNQQEYEQLRSFYNNVYKAALVTNKFSKRKGLRTYLKNIANNNSTLKNIKRRKLKKMTMTELIKITTGFVINEDSLMNMTPKKWIKNKEISSEAVIDYFEQFREIAAKLAVSKGDTAIRVEHEGQVFYWLNEEYVPIIESKIE